VTPLLPEELSGGDWCDISVRWLLDQRFAQKLVLSADDFTRETGREVRIISGYRTREEQVALGKSGRPTAPDRLSTHRSCPATGADIQLGFLPVQTHKHIWGRILFMNGLRFGGGSPVVEETGLPEDWQHVDAGPRV